MANLEKCQEKIDRLDATYRAKYPNGFWGWVSSYRDVLDNCVKESDLDNFRFIIGPSEYGGVEVVSNSNSESDINISTTDWIYHHPFPTDTTQPDPIPPELPSPLQELREETEKKLKAIARLEELDGLIESKDDSITADIEVLDGLINERNELWEGVK